MGLIHLHPELADSIEGLYVAFSGYPLPAYTDPCLHCHTLDNDAKLRSEPLRELSVDELRDYAVDALLVWGDQLVFKYFLPRIYELYLTVDGPKVFCDPEMLLKKFKHGGWRTWPMDEQVSIERFLHALWALVINDPRASDSYTDLESWLCSIAQAEDDLSSYLEHWIMEESEQASLALSSLLLSSSVALDRKRGRNAFWEDRDSQYRQLQDWVKTSAVHEKLRKAMEASGSRELADEFEAALSILT